MPNDIISKIKVGTVTYDINDSRVDSITSKIDSLSSAMILKGKSKQTLTDGGNENPEATSGSRYNGDAGDVWLQYGPDEYQEFVWIIENDIGHWEVLGDEGSYTLKTFAHEYQPAGSINTPIFTGTGTTITSTASYQPAGSISQPTATAEEITLTHNLLIRYRTNSDTISSTNTYIPWGTISTPTVTTKTFTGTTTTLSIAASYQPEGTVSQQSFTGATATITVTTNNAVTAVDAHTYQPEGTISTPSLTFSTTTLTSTTISVNNEILSIPTVCLTGPSGAISYATGISAPTFTGTTATLSHSLTKATVTSTGNYQPTGSISKPSFTGTTATIGSDIEYQPKGTIDVVLARPAFSGESATISISNHTFTPQITVATPTFSGTTTTITSTASYQPAGAISQPVFIGTTVNMPHDTPTAGIIPPSSPNIPI